MENLNNFIFISLLSIFVLVGLYKARQVKTVNQYLLAGRKTKLFALVATLVMTEFNTSTLIAFSSAGYYAHGWALTLPSIFLIGLLFYAATVAKQWKLFNGISVAHYFTQRYGRDIGIFVAIILFLAMAGFSATYIKSLTLFFTPFFHSFVSPYEHLVTKWRFNFDHISHHLARWLGNYYSHRYHQFFISNRFLSIAVILRSTLVSNKFTGRTALINANATGAAP